MPTKLHIFMGAGGVGKTTVSAGFALALAKSGKKVALFSIDPARRLQDALGVKTLTETGVFLPLPSHFKGSCLASTIHVRETIDRWVLESNLGSVKKEKLFLHPMYNALCDRFATSTDTFAGARISEWLQSGDFTDIVIDTAPGLHALDFLTKPEKIIDFFDGKLVEWLRLFFGQESQQLNFVQKIVKNSAKKLLDGMSKIGGAGMVSSLADFFILLEHVFTKMVERVKYTSEHLKSVNTQFYVVASVRNDALRVAVSLKNDLAKLRYHKTLFVLNRCLPEYFFEDISKIFEQQTLNFENFLPIQENFKQLQALQTQIRDELLHQSTNNKSILNLKKNHIENCVNLPWLVQSKDSEIIESLYILGDFLLNFLKINTKTNLNADLNTNGG